MSRQNWLDMIEFDIESYLLSNWREAERYEGEIAVYRKETFTHQDESTRR